jgi:hypothetical protein
MGLALQIHWIDSTEAADEKIDFRTIDRWTAHFKITNKAINNELIVHWDVTHNSARRVRRSDGTLWIAGDLTKGSRPMDYD